LSKGVVSSRLTSQSKLMPKSRFSNYIYLIHVLAWQDIRSRYRRSLIGPFWLTLSMGVMIFTIAFVFSRVFEGASTDYTLHLTCGIILWTFFSGTISDSCMSLIASERIIKQQQVPIVVHSLSTIWKNVLILGHNIIIIPMVLIYAGKGLTSASLLFIPAFLLVLLSIVWISVLCAVICTRYRDMTQIIKSILQVAFYFTPVIWVPSRIVDADTAHLIEFNLFFHFLEILRNPFLGQASELSSWIVSLLSALVGAIFTSFLYIRYKRRVPYWL